MTAEAWKNIRGSKNTPDQIMLSVKENPAENMTVRWRTDVSVTDGYALFRKKDSEDEWQRAAAKRNPFKTDVDESSFFFADMTGLSPDTYYEYNCGNDTDRSETYYFRTAKKDTEKFSFLCTSDVQTGGAEPPADYSVLGEVLKKVLADHPECEFILTAGDNTNCGQTDVQWTGLFEGLRGICEYIPVQFCMGNHDDMGFEDYFTYTGKYYSEHATYFTNQLRYSYPENGPESWQIPNYSFRYGNTLFAIAGTSGFEYINEWLKKTAEESDATWKFSAHHFPVCYSGPNLECYETYPPMKEGIEKYDIMFSGHEHSYARSFPRRDDGLYDRPSEGTIHYNIGSGNRNPPGTRVVPKVWNDCTYEHEEDLSMFSIVDIDGDKCTLTAYVEDGRIVDRCTIDKADDSITPIRRAPVYNRPRLKFKGYDLGLCVMGTLPECIDGVWYVPAGQIVKFMGGESKHSVGKMRVEVYDRFAEFTENSDIMVTADGEIKMTAPCLRLARDQLFVPCDDFCKPFRMYWTYFKHNNFISIESETEHLPVSFQP